MVTSFTDWNPNELYHFGTKGMKWGQRRYQNPDGSLTALGKERYGKEYGYSSARQMARDLNRLDIERAGATHRANQLGKVYQIDRLKAKLGKKRVQSNEKKKAKIESNIQKIEEGLSDSRRTKAENYRNLSKKSEKMVQKILNRAKDSGYTVQSIHTSRFVQSKRDMAWALAGVISGASMPGTHYRVKNRHSSVSKANRKY